MKLLIAFLMCSSIFASDIKVKELESYKYLSMIAHENLMDECHNSSNQKECISNEMKELKRQTLTKMNNSIVIENFNQEIARENPLMGLPTNAKEGAWNFEGDRNTLSDSLLDITISDLMMMDEDISLDQLIDIIIAEVKADL